MADCPVRVDGVLDEPIWARAAVINVPYEIEPGNNTPAAVRTECLLAHDRSYLYVAFRAFDPDPSSIRANLTDRDQGYRDDFVGITLDTFNDERRGFEFFCNPLGVQTDLTRNDMNRDENEDPTWDAIWDSAGRITAEGYAIEMAIPFASLRFPRTPGEQTWGIVVIRTRPRDFRYQYASIPIDRGRDCLLCQAGKARGFAGITPGHSIELDPTLTAHRTDERAGFDAPAIEKGPVKAELGGSARWGVTPNLSLNAAANPDFSQIEADAVRLDINTRYALYYEEKRPFFLEGSDFFHTIFQTVYTRSVADPSWGIKLTGKEGKHAVGAFVTRDESPNIIIPSMSDPAPLQHPVTSGVFRYRRDLGASSTGGILMTDREGDGYHNRVYGADGLIHFTRSDAVTIQALGTSTQYPEDGSLPASVPTGEFGGFAGAIQYNHSVEKWSFDLTAEEMDPGFRADAGYIERVDVASLYSEINRHVYGENTWFSRLDFGAEALQSSAVDGELTDREITLSSEYHGPLQTYIELQGSTWKELYANHMYSGALLHRFHFEFQPSGAFKGWFSGGAGDAIDYENARAATRVSGGPGFNLDLGGHFHGMVDHTYEHLDVHGKRLYTVNIIDSRFVYQFNVRTYARAILQYENIDRHPDVYLDPTGIEPHTRHLFSQFLVSYKINPQTVLYVGYSEDRESRAAVSARPLDRTVFMKIGYAWLI